MLKSNQGTKASQALRNAARQIREARRNLEEQLDAMKYDHLLCYLSVLTTVKHRVNGKVHPKIIMIILLPMDMQIYTFGFVYVAKGQITHNYVKTSILVTSE